MAWRLAETLHHLTSEVNALWPKRDKSSDGSIGNEEHADRKSDHNPNKQGVVRAKDIDDDFGPDDTIPFRIAEHLRLLGEAGFGPLQNGGYIIYYRKYCSEKTGWMWRDYDGFNAHKSHLHISCGRDARQYDAKNSWRIADVIRKPIPLFPNTPPPVKEEDMYALIKGNASDEIWLTDMQTKRLMSDQVEANFYLYAIVGSGGRVKVTDKNLPEEWPQAYVDAIPRSDANIVDASMKWWAADEKGPLHDIIGQVLEG